MAVYWRGRRFDSRTRNMLVEVAATTKPYIRPIQGSYNKSVSASAGTHSGGGAVDISVSGWSRSTIDAVVKQLRRVGFAAWYRPASRSWIAHIHAIAIGCSDLSTAARQQVVAYRNGRNGLANNGRDNGPKVGYTTWERYLRAKTPKPKPTPKPTPPKEWWERPLTRDELAQIRDYVWGRPRSDKIPDVM